jgi:outer membrane lipoprotein SlyB
MKLARLFTLMSVFTLPAAAGCVAHSTSSTTWVAEPPPQEWARPGRVEWVRETVHREQGDPAAGAAVGAVVGGLLFGHDAPSAVIGAIGGAAVGAAASQGSGEHRSYEVCVRYDDGAAQIFVYQGQAPFRPGEPVVLTPRGLYRQQ